MHSDGVVRYYDLKEAQGSQYLRELEKGRYAQSDTYVTHEEVAAADKPSVLLVSNKRILFIVYSQVLGTWSIDWEFALPDITGPPPVETDEYAQSIFYLCIKPKEERKKRLGLFGGSAGKRVIMPSRQAARLMANTIEDLRKECVDRE